MFPRGVSGQRSAAKNHRPRDDSQEQQTILRERFTELGASARRFLDGLLRDQRCGKAQALRVLAPLGTYATKDLVAALDRAVRFNAFSANAVERILPDDGLAETARPGQAQAPDQHLLRGIGFGDAARAHDVSAAGAALCRQDDVAVLHPLATKRGLNCRSSALGVPTM